jgi:hypothetical protein
VVTRQLCALGHLPTAVQPMLHRQPLQQPCCGISHGHCVVVLHNLHINVYYARLSPMSAGPNICVWQLVDVVDQLTAQK